MPGIIKCNDKMVMTEKGIFIEAFKKRTRKFAVDVIYILQFNHLRI